MGQRVRFTISRSAWEWNQSYFSKFAAKQHLDVRVTQNKTGHAGGKITIECSVEFAREMVATMRQWLALAAAPPINHNKDRGHATKMRRVLVRAIAAIKTSIYEGDAIG